MLIFHFSLSFILISICRFSGRDSVSDIGSSVSAGSPCESYDSHPTKSILVERYRPSSRESDSAYDNNCNVLNLCNDEKEQLSGKQQVLKLIRSRNGVDSPCSPRIDNQDSQSPSQSHLVTPSKGSNHKPNIRITNSGAKIINDTVFSRIITDTLRPKIETSPISGDFIRRNTADSGVFTLEENEDSDSLADRVTPFEKVDSPEIHSDQVSEDSLLNYPNISNNSEPKTQRERPKNYPEIINNPDKTKIYSIRNGKIASHNRNRSKMDSKFQTSLLEGGSDARNGMGCKFCTPYAGQGSWEVSSEQRINAKQELQDLNQRLSSYIQQMQMLREQEGHTDSSALVHSISVLEDELANIKAMYERELEALR